MKSFLLIGMKYDDYVCIFKFEYNELLQTLTPVLLNARHLQGKNYSNYSIERIKF